MGDRYRRVKESESSMYRFNVCFCFKELDLRIDFASLPYVDSLKSYLFLFCCIDDLKCFIMKNLLLLFYRISKFTKFLASSYINLLIRS